jgi:hypothetical protein
MRKWIAWRLALAAWAVGLDRAGNHFEDVAFCGRSWFGRAGA